MIRYRLTRDGKSDVLLIINAKKTKVSNLKCIFTSIQIIKIKAMSDMQTTNDEEEPIVTCSELLEQIEDEEEELDRERALYGNCDVDKCTYTQV